MNNRFLYISQFKINILTILFDSTGIHKHNIFYINKRCNNIRKLLQASLVKYLHTLINFSSHIMLSQQVFEVLFNRFHLIKLKWQIFWKIKCCS